MFSCPAGVVLGRVVRVPSGPLLRVEGTDVSISCNVTDYEGPVEQDFDWTVSSGAGPAVAVISTWDSSFTHSSYKERVKSGAVQLQRTGNSEIVLRLQRLKASDEGNYTCSTPSTDATYSGNYEAHVQLKVIPDALRLKVPRGRRSSLHNITEGGSFRLPCSASLEDSATHAHLSLTWQRQSGASVSEVLTLTHLGRLHPGTKYAGRYSDGELRVDTAADDTYQLTVEAAQPWDAGEYSCVARTWVQGPDGWEKIQEKAAAVAQVEVRPIELTASIVEPALVVSEGAPFNLSCLVSVDSSVPLITRVRWFHSHLGELHHLPSGPDPDQETTGTHQLLVPQAWDSGDYTCRASAWILLSNGTWHRAAEGTSPPVTVQVTHDAPDLEVSLNISVAPQVAEEPSELLCLMSGGPHLSVSWYFTPSHGISSPILVGALDQEGSLRAGATYQQRVEKGELILSRRGPQTFVLRIQWTSEEDKGGYHCTGTSWRQLRNNSWSPTAEKMSAPATLSWVSEGSSIMVDARLLKMVSVAGGTFEMICTVQPQNLPSPQYSVQVTLRPPQENAAPISVITLSRDGVIRRRPSAVSSTMLEKGKEGAYLFRLYQAQSQDVGAYQCEIAAWTQGGGGAWRMALNKTSNSVRLEFQTSGPVFNVTARSDSLSVYRGDRSEFWCIITIDGPAVDPDDMAFEVSWFVQRAGGSSAFLAAVDRNAQVRHNQRNSSSEVSLERVSDMEYRLRVYGCEDEDAGGHYCTVTPWVRSGEGGWSRQETITSTMMSLNVKMDLLSAFRYPLLIGVGLSLLAGLLSCLIGYCSSRFCCKAQPVPEKRREHRRLMSMEMD
ncbi:prostaglandin F2 receptor negative regulator-like [Hyla sarda]|uniref:prostaglandin F2 receptor negative regulator-like n=1 Tax=Hyla sarda TaxID=327740 RepID=UPI0024C41C3D|nr:prostaglandin F2 receptor negative regulator-like [Hyla sarda]